MPTAELKLTKKQKKALAFRSRSKHSDETNGDVPQPQAQSSAASALENESDSGEERDAQEMGHMDAQITADNESKVTSEARMYRKVESSLRQAAKRKRETSDDDGQSGEERKKMKKEGTSDSKKERFILFVGNLKYTTTVETIRQHFSSCDPPPDVRLLTPKSTTGKRSTKSKGCAFVEFTNRKGLQQALKLHQSKLDGRMINVELTAGGGGKGEVRLKKLQGRNKTLYSQRQKTKQGTSDTTDSNQPQRYSVTSGVGQAPKQKRTWSVGNAVDKSKRRRPMKNLATGVNSIPVG